MNPMTWTARDLPILPTHLEKLIERARHLNATEIWLYGSRARGDATPQSDFDLAFKLPENSTNQWNSFCASIQDDPPSLYRYDLVQFEQVSREFQEKIMTEGKKIYERRL